MGEGGMCQGWVRAAGICYVVFSWLGSSLFCCPSAALKKENLWLSSQWATPSGNKFLRYTFNICHASVGSLKLITVTTMSHHNTYKHVVVAVIPFGNCHKFFFHLMLSQVVKHSNKEVHFIEKNCKSDLIHMSSPAGTFRVFKCHVVYYEAKPFRWPVTWIGEQIWNEGKEM